jgi:ABC-type nitrate/sulfonate/bicarbonate transport system ATPase subunit
MDIKIANLTFCHPAKAEPAIRDLNLSISEGFSALLGASGSGKTTLLEIIAGIYRPDTPAVRLEGKISIDGSAPGVVQSPNELAMMFQYSALLDHLTVLENTLLPIILSANRTQDADIRRAESLLEELQVYKTSTKPRELSGGTQKRVDLARVLLCRPRILLLDEPFSGIDILTKEKIYRLLYRERNKSGFITIFATHDLTDAALLASTVYFFGTRNGHSVCDIIDNDPAIEAGNQLEDWISKAKGIEPMLAKRLHEVTPDEKLIEANDAVNPSFS